MEVGAEVKGGDGVRLETYLCGKSKHGVCGGISHLLHYHFSVRWTMLYGAVFIESHVTLYHSYSIVVALH